uniref:Uncharacterized protein n=1 Tax=Tanacetum cinerariifolium TaxID=118510 RepID=A0A6L2MDD0_TANCI|nr:hypothetical protein [Tanacetum cinerariifolium]
MERKGKGSPSTAMLKLCRALILAFPDGTKNFVVYNASQNRFGTIMMQKEKAIAFDSRQLKFHEKNYTTHDLELGDIVKANVAPDALSRNKRAKPLRVRALVMTINSNLPPKIHKEQVESLKKENVKDENLYGMEKSLGIVLMELSVLGGGVVSPMARYGSRHHHLCQQVLDVSKDEGRLTEAIWFTGTVAYRLELPEQLSSVHSTFYVSKLKKCMVEEPLAIPLDEIQVDKKLNFIEEPIEFMDRELWTCLNCDSGTGSSFTYDPIPESFDGVQINPNPPLQCHFNIYLCQICESNSHYGYECSQRVPLVYEPEPCYNQNFSDSYYSHDLPGVNLLIDHHCCYECENSLNDFFSYQCTCEFCGNGAHVGYNCLAQVSSFQTLPSFPQQYPCCEDCEVTHEPYQCQPKNHDYYHEQNSCYNSNSFGFDYGQPLRYTINHPIFNVHNDFLSSRTTLMEQMTYLTSMCEMLCQIVQKKREEKRIEEEQAAKAQNSKMVSNILLVIIVMILWLTLVRFMSNPTIFTTRILL